MTTGVLERVMPETTEEVEVLKRGVGSDVLDYGYEHPEMLGEPLIEFLRRDISPIGYIFRSSKKHMGKISNYAVDEKGLYQGRRGFRLMLLDSGEVVKKPTYVTVRSGYCLLDRCVGLDLISYYSGNILDLNKSELKPFEALKFKVHEKTPEEKQLAVWLNSLDVK
jgi:hypothetical protein